MSETMKLSQVHLARGTHSAELYELVKKSWQEDTPLILCPPQLSQLPDLTKIDVPDKMILGVFTSGTSTGQPRLVLYSKKNIISSLEAIRKLFQVDRIDHIFCYPQPTHVFGLVLGYLQSIVYNLPISFSPGSYSHRAHELWNAKLTPGTLTLGTPVHFFDLMRFNQKHQIKPRMSYSSIAGGAPVTVKLWNDMKTTLNIESPSIGYGASEASPGICHLPPGVEPEFNGDVGQALDGVRINNITSQGFYFKGDNVCLGIVDNDRYLADEWILIKDQIEKLDRYCVFGRSDLAINRGGLKYHPEILEATLMAEGVKALVMPLYDERLGQEVALLVETNAPGKEVALRAQIKEAMLNHHELKLKDQLIVFGLIPLNANLKINRKEALKRVIKSIHIQMPISTQLLKPFMPHRSSAIWVDEITNFQPKEGQGRVYIDPKKFYVTDSKVRASALVEFIAQTYGYSFVLDEIFNNVEISQAKNTFIAEVRDVKYSNLSVLDKLVMEASKDHFFDVNVSCTHDFVKIKVIKGEVKYQEKKLVELTMKVAVF